ncbi:MAG TPA: hypothetical protein EYN79_07425 [Planctomycetes bacterium]|nr:hypothetical protein [Planctomycetota bacterium]HIN80250.1 hypothetical protein [Planctomycetota bacterium]
MTIEARSTMSDSTKSNANTSPGRVVPLFPLPDLILFPGQLLPLHVFEPRYLEMTEDLLDTSGELVLGTVLGDDKQLLSGVAPVQQVAGLGRLSRYQALEDGRFILIVLGIGRVEVHPHDGSTSYPLTEVQLIEENESALCPDLRGDQQMRLRAALAARGNTMTIGEQVSINQMADILLMLTPLTVEERYKTFAIRPLERRVEAVLAAHEVAPIIEIPELSSEEDGDPEFES